ncbi:MAG: SDR family oxidoreductase [Spirochaetales bacterium]|nr:SDR family oxidoreductase [Spirochaetales bacterium]
MEKYLAGRRALVVGGSGGIGAAVSVALARRGAQLFIHGGHSLDRLEAVAAQARGHTAPVATHLQEIVEPGDAGALLDFAGDVDILVVSFGPYLEGLVGETSPEQWEQMIGLNLNLPALLVSGLLPGMVDRGFGRILLFGGPRTDRNEGYRQIAAYGAAKHGLASLTRSVARQYASRNIRCNMICPGYVDTEYYSEEQKTEIASRQPQGRLISVDEIATLAVRLLDPASESINGAIIPVDIGV